MNDEKGEGEVNKNGYLLDTDVLELNENIVLLYGEIEAVLEQAGQVIGDFDVLIASTAITHDITLVSGNERHFQRIVNLFGQLQFEQWNVN